MCGLVHADQPRAVEHQDRARVLDAAATGGQPGDRQRRERERPVQLRQRRDGPRELGDELVAFGLVVRAEMQLRPVDDGVADGERADGDADVARGRDRGMPDAGVVGAGGRRAIAGHDDAVGSRRRDGEIGIGGLTCRAFGGEVDEILGVPAEAALPRQQRMGGCEPRVALMARRVDTTESVEGPVTQRDREREVGRNGGAGRDLSAERDMQEAALGAGCGIRHRVRRGTRAVVGVCRCDDDAVAFRDRRLGVRSQPEHEFRDGKVGREHHVLGAGHGRQIGRDGERQSQLRPVGVGSGISRWTGRVGRRRLRRAAGRGRRRRRTRETHTRTGLDVGARRECTRRDEHHGRREPGAPHDRSLRSRTHAVEAHHGACFGKDGPAVHRCGQTRSRRAHRRALP